MPLDEDVKQSIIDNNGTYKFNADNKIKMKPIKDADPYVPWTSKQISDYEQGR